MSNFTNGQFLVGSPSHSKWIKVSAKTLRGAKRCATNEFQISFGGKIQVAQAMGEGYQQQVVKLSVKHGYDNWVDAP